MNDELYKYDVFPKVFPEGKPVEITIRPLGKWAELEQGGKYTLVVLDVGEGFFWVPDYKWRQDNAQLEVTPDEDGCIRFTHVFHGEQPHALYVFKTGLEYAPYKGILPKFDLSVTVYSLHEDLCGFYPFRGDLHMHTTGSDGKQSPAIVAAAYRQAGLDFTVISDHFRYFPSLDAIRAYADVPIEFTIVPGEEVHLPDNDIHIVNFGSTYSVNALIRGRPHNLERGEAISERAIVDDPPPVIDEAEFKRQVNELIPTLDIPDEIEAFPYAACVWIFRHIRKGGGLGIFAHPYWHSMTWQVPEAFTRYMLEQKPFDAFEVIGGTPALHQNRLQTALYHEMRSKGYDFPVVGSTDSHSCYNNPDGAHICSTIIFARENTREELIKGVLAGRSVAVDTLGTPEHVIGVYRLEKYVDFLLEYFFPLHDELCFEEGRLMKGYVTGDKRAEPTLRFISGRMREQREKYFQF